MEASLAGELGKFIPPGLLALWRRRGIETLLPLQYRAVRGTGLMDGRNLLVVAPSSSGKSLIGELAAARALAAGRRAVLLSPTKALAEQQYAAFETGLAGLGFRVLCATADRPESDPAAVAGRFDVLIAVPEKLRAYLASDTGAIAGVGVVVVDEIQMLSDPLRGPLLDLLVTQLLHSPYTPQIVALAPELTEPEPLADWLGAELLRFDQRPIPLREGVLNLSDGTFRFRERQPGAESPGTTSISRLFPAGELSRLEELAENAALEQSFPLGEENRALIVGAAALARTHGPVLLFAPTRRCSRRWAGLLATMQPGFPPARIALAALDHAAESGRITERLRDCLTAGIAFHNADMDSGLRSLVENAYRVGEVRLLVSTATLGMGVNLAAGSVVHTPWRLGSALETMQIRRRDACCDLWRRAAVSSIPLPLGRAQFSNQGGRAGRFGQGVETGISVLVAQSDEEAERLWQGLVLAPAEELNRAPLATLSPEEIILGLLAGGLGRTTGNLLDAFKATFSARLGVPSWDEISPEHLEGELKSLRRAGLTRSTPNGLWGLTGLGEAVVRGSVSPASLSLFRSALDEWEESHGISWQAEHAFLFRLGMTLEGEMALAGLPFARKRPPLPLPERADEMTDESTSWPHTPENLSRREIRAWCAASALVDWIAGVETIFLEEKYDLYAGSLASAAESMARLVFSASAIARTLRMAPESALRLPELGERLVQGLIREALPLGRLRIAGLRRDRLNALGREGLGNPKQFGSMPTGELERRCGPDLARRLKKAVSPLPRNEAGDLPCGPREPKNSASPAVEAKPKRPSPEPRLEINLQSPGVIQANGRDVQLPPLGFDLLIALAERPGEVVTRDALYHRLWPDGGPEEQQLDAHRRRLIERLRPVIGSEAPRVAEVVRGIGFRLTLGASRVRLRGTARGG